MALGGPTCPLCRCDVAQCQGCKAWVVAGTECVDCGKVTKTRRQFTKVPRETATYGFAGSGAAVAPPYYLRLLFLVGGLYFAAHAVAGLGAGGVKDALQGLPGAGMKWPAAAGAAGALLFLAAAMQLWMAKVRLGRTAIDGARLESHAGALGWAGNAVMAVLTLALTAGLGLPWVYGRFLRAVHRRCVVPTRGRFTLDFSGTGDEVLWRFGVTLLMAPLVIGTGGLLGLLVSWLWLSWEHGNLVVPDRNGTGRRPKFEAGFGGFFARAFVGSLLTLATGGLYGPWAKAAQWRWLASRVSAPK
jgi:hypothetical protein